MKDDDTEESATATTWNIVGEETERTERDEDFDPFDALVNYTSSSGAIQDEKIVDVNLTPNTTQDAEFHGAYLDIGASRSVIGKPQAEFYCHYMGIPLVLQGTNSSKHRIFRFGKDKQPGMVQAKIRIPYATGRHIYAVIDVINIDVPLLLRLDILKKYKLYLNNVDNLLLCVDPKWSAPIVRKKGHVYYEWIYDVMNT